MGIKQTSEGFAVSFHKRHPTTKKPISLRRNKIKMKAQAEKVYRELILKVDRLIQAQTVPTWERFLMEYEKSLGITDITLMTIYNRLSVLRYNTFPEWQDKLVNEITTEDIHQIIRVRMADKSEAHKKFFTKCIKATLDYALNMNYVNRNPTPLLKFKISEKIKNGLNEQQIITLLKKAQECDWHWYPHYAMAIYTGMRNGELYALEWSNVCIETRKIFVKKSWSSKDGFKSTKSGDDRVLEIPAPLMPLLAELKLKSAGNLFVLPRMNKWDKGEQARELRFFLQSIGLPILRFHDLRATWATWLLSKGVPASKVMAMGGWRNMDTMMIYMRKAGIDIKGATSVLDNISTHGVSDAKVIEFASM